MVLRCLPVVDIPVRRGTNLYLALFEANRQYPVENGELMLNFKRLMV